MNDMSSDKAMWAKFQGIEEPAELAKVAKEAGYDVTGEEMVAAEAEFKREVAAKTDADTDEVLSLDDIADVAGGVFGKGEDAGDGREMGCFMSFHHIGYQKENNEWCKDNYYCKQGPVQFKNCHTQVLFE